MAKKFILQRPFSPERSKGKEDQTSQTTLAPQHQNDATSQTLLLSVQKKARFALCDKYPSTQATLSVWHHKKKHRVLRASLGSFQSVVRTAIVNPIMRFDQIPCGASFWFLLPFTAWIASIHGRPMLIELAEAFLLRVCAALW